jgi:sulfide:quinone oxidoreductase
LQLHEKSRTIDSATSKLLKSFTNRGYMMAKVVIIGAGFAGQTAALYLGDALGKNHDITMINMSDRFLYVPSLVWVGVGHMHPDKPRFSLKPVYDRMNVNFIHGIATEVHADEQYVIAEKKDGSGQAKVDYDYLIVATGPKLNFAGTPGLGPDIGNTYSICTAFHAIQARDKYLEAIERMKHGDKQKIVIGAGHPSSTCQGAAFEYITNVHKDLRNKGLRDKAEIVYLSNERYLGDFGVGGLQVKKTDKTTTSHEFVEAIFKEYDIKWEIRRGVKEVDGKKINWEDYDGKYGETTFDFAMLIPQFQGMPLKYIDKNGDDISDMMLNKAGFVLVDGLYGLSYSELIKQPEAWPAKYQSPKYKNIFAAGIAFAPPGPISVPHETPNGTQIAAAPPRTGMISGIIGRLVAINIIDLIENGSMTHNERMTEMVAACIASLGDSLWDGSAATIVLYPVVPDLVKYPNDNGRDNFVTHMEMGLSGAWMKRMLHTTFIHKLQGKIGWKIIPE